MRFAALETSTDWCSVALWLDGEIRALERRAGNRHSEYALPMLEALTKGVGPLDAIAFGAGPGSFTGLRIACGLAQGLAFAHGLPVLGVSTLEAMAEEAGAPRVVACLDARMREVYVANVERGDAGWIETEPARVLAPALVAPPPGTGWLGAGNGFAAYPELARALALARVDATARPTAQAIGALAQPRLARGDGVAAADALPIYVRHRVALTAAERAAGKRL